VLILVLCSQLAGDVSHKPGAGCHYFPPGPQSLRGLLSISLLGKQGHDGCEQLPETVTRQRRGCDLNQGSNALQSSTLKLLEHFEIIITISFDFKVLLCFKYYFTRIFKISHYLQLMSNDSLFKIYIQRQLTFPITVYY